MADTTIVEVEASPWDIELTEPFGIATGAQTIANNVLVRIRLSDGTVGIGEAAPFPAVNGETQQAALAAITAAANAIVGDYATRFRRVASKLRESTAEAPSARAAIESAVFDAVSRHAGLSLCHYFGGATAANEFA